MMWMNPGRMRGRHLGAFLALAFSNLPAIPLPGASSGDFHGLVSNKPGEILVGKFYRCFVSTRGSVERADFVFQKQEIDIHDPRASQDPRLLQDRNAFSIVAPTPRYFSISFEGEAGMEQVKKRVEQFRPGYTLFVAESNGAKDFRDIHAVTYKPVDYLSRLEPRFTPFHTNLMGRFPEALLEFTGDSFSTYRYLGRPLTSAQVLSILAVSPSRDARDAVKSYDRYRGQAVGLLLGSLGAMALAVGVGAGSTADGPPVEQIRFYSSMIILLGSGGLAIGTMEPISRSQQSLHRAIDYHNLFARSSVGVRLASDGFSFQLAYQW